MTQKICRRRSARFIIRFRDLGGATMKRKGQSTEFRPPQQKTARVSRLNSRKSTTSGETSELQPTDRNQVGSQSLLYLQSASLIDSYGEHQPEIDSGLVKILVDVEQTNMNKTESAERNDIKNKPQSGITLDHEPKAAAAVEEMDNETEDTSSHELQTSHAAQSSPNNPCHRYSLNDTGESILCGDVQENRIQVLDPKTIGVHLEGVSGAVGEKSCFDSETKSQATEETESLKPPAKKRLRRRMGMCGLGDRKRRFLLEGQHCKQVLSGGESLVAEAAGEKNKDNTEVGNEGTTMMDDGGAMKQVLLEQLILQDVNKIQDEPSAVASEPDIELTAIAEPNLPGNGAIDGQDLEITMNSKGLLEEEGLRSNNKLTKGTFEVAQETTDSLVAEEASYDCIDVSNGVCEGPKETLECSVEVNEEGRLIGLANEVCDGSKETEKCPVAEQVSYGVTHEGCEGSKEASEYPVAEQVSYGVTRDVCEGSKETSEYPVAEQVSYGVTRDVCEGSKETSEYSDAEQVSYGVTRGVCEGSKETSEYPVAEQVSYRVTHEGCEGSKEASEYPVSEQVSYGVTCAICEGSKETSEYPVAEQVSYGVTRDVCEGSKETSEYPVAEQVSYGVTHEGCEGSKVASEYPVTEQVSYGVTCGICEGSKETSEYPLAEQVSYGVTRDVCEGSKETSEYPVAEQVSYGVTRDVCEGSKETSEYPVAEQVSYGVTRDVCEGSKETSEYPVAEQVSYGVTRDVCEGSKETSEYPVAEQVSYGVTRDVCEGSKETSEYPVAEQVSYGVTRDVCEGSKETSEYPVAEQVSYGVTRDVCEGSKETSEYPVAEQVSYGVTRDVCEGSKETSEYPVAEQVSYGVTRDVCEGSKETSEYPVAEQVSYGVTRDVCEGSKETSEYPVAEQVSYGVTRDVCEGSKETSEYPVAEQVSSGVTDEVCEVLTEVTQGPVAIYEAVIYESTSVTKEVCEDSNETTECPGAADVSYGSIAVTYEIREVWEGSEEITQGPVTLNEALRYGSTAVTQKETSEYAVAEQVSHGVTNDICEGSKETAKCLVAAKVISSPNCATGDIYKGSKEASEGPVDKALKVFYGSNSDGVCEGCKETTELPVNVGEEVNYGSSSVSDEVCGGSKAPDINQIEVSEEVSHGSIAVTNKVCDGFIDPTERPTEISEEVSCGFTGVNEVHEVTIPVSKEVQESRTALEKSEIEVEEQYPAVNYKHLVSPSLDVDATTELDLDGPQLSMSTGAEVDPVFMDHTVTVATTSPELAFAEICDAEDQCDDVEFPQTPTKAVPGSIGPSAEGGSNTEELRMPEAPPTNQEEHMHFYLGQDACDPLVTPAITQEPVSNPTLTPATEFPQDHDVVPLSLYSVTDSQLNSLALSLEVDDPPIPEAFLHQEDATELVCGLVKELSSLNRIVMAAYRETELLRRGNRPPKAQIRRDLAFTP
ncbi:hypothetical protein SRHO_G00180800 [Serrasalmus rhombeus]